VNQISFIRGEGGLGRPLAGKDHVCGLVGFCADGDLPIGFASNDRIKVIYSYAEAVALGLDNSGLTLDPDVAVVAYAIQTAFEAQPKAVIYVGLFEKAATAPLIGATEFEEILTLARFAEGDITLLGVVTNEELATGDLTILQGIANDLEEENKPISSILYSPNTSNFRVGGGMGDELSDLPDLRDLLNKKVSVVIGADGSNLGKSLYNYYEIAFSALGACLGTLAAGKVNENIAWVGKNNINANALNEFDVPMLTGGDLVKMLSPSLVNGLNSKGYIFLIKHSERAGTYFNDSHTATVVTSDYAFIESNRTIDKAIRGCRSFLLPDLNSPIFVNPDGTLTEDTIAGLKNSAARALEQMERDGEISTFQVVINPTQNTISTGKVIITIKIIPVGVARNIEVNIGFAVRIN
jgi:hypothetical protein